MSHKIIKNIAKPEICSLFSRCVIIVDIYVCMNVGLKKKKMIALILETFVSKKPRGNNIRICNTKMHEMFPCSHSCQQKNPSEIAERQRNSLRLLFNHNCIPKVSFPRKRIQLNFSCHVWLFIFLFVFSFSSGKGDFEKRQRTTHWIKKYSNFLCYVREVSLDVLICRPVIFASYIYLVLNIFWQGRKKT